MSTLRPELRSCVVETVTPASGTAYFMILEAVRTQPGLVHGTLHLGAQHCAIGSFFTVNPKLALPTALIDEVAAVNDAMPLATPRQRKTRVMQWLRWKLDALGMPGMRRGRPLKKHDDLDFVAGPPPGTKPAARRWRGWRGRLRRRAVESGSV